MARKKAEILPIVNGLEATHVVEKSRPLMLMREVPFGLGELKVLDTYLSRINARDPEATTVRFSKSEYETLMGIDRMHPDRLGKYVDRLMGKIITVPDPTARGGWTKYTLFAKSECYQDENEQWWINLSCTKEAKKLFFDIESIGYIRYQLKNVLPMTSKYSVLLYVYLLDNRFRGAWTIPLHELRETVFRCDSEFYAANFKNFKQDILDKSLREVNDKTDLEYEYEPIKTGRRVTGIKFALIKDNVELPLEQDPHQLTLEGYDDVPAHTAPDNSLYASVLPADLTPEQVELLRELAADVVPYDSTVDLATMQLRVADFLSKKVKLMNSQKKTVKNKFAWLKKAITEDWQ